MFPVACLVTNNWGVIEEANQAAQDLLNVHGGLPAGKQISVFVAPSERREFRDRLTGIPPSEVWGSCVPGAWARAIDGHRVIAGTCH